MTILTGFHGMNLGMDIVQLKGSTSNTDSILQVGIAKNGRKGTLKSIKDLDTMVDKFVESGVADIALIAWLLVMVCLSLAGKFGWIIN